MKLSDLLQQMMSSANRRPSASKTDPKSDSGDPYQDPDTIHIDPRDLFGSAQDAFGKREAQGELEYLLMHQLATLALMKERARQRTPRYIWDFEIVDNLVNVASDIVKKHPNTRFFGVGNSPSYLIYGMECLSPQLDCPISTNYVPFSGRYLYARDLQHGDKALVYDIQWGTPDQRAAQYNQKLYRKFLENLGLNPREIIEGFRQTGERTALVDNVQSGGSFASFIHFMYSWAQEEGYRPDRLSRAMKCIALSDEPIPSVISIPESRLSVPIEVKPISRNLRYALNGNLSMNTDRFVPHYDPTEWSKPPEKISHENEDISRELKRMIKAGADKKFSHRPILRLRGSETSAAPE